jgi:hypothetical protein
VFLLLPPQEQQLCNTESPMPQQPMMRQQGVDLTNMTVTWSRIKPPPQKKTPKYSETADMDTKHNIKVKLSLSRALKHNTGAEIYATFQSLPWCNIKVKELQFS